MKIQNIQLNDDKIRLKNLKSNIYLNIYFMYHLDKKNLIIFLFYFIHFFFFLLIEFLPYNCRKYFFLTIG